MSEYELGFHLHWPLVLAVMCWAQARGWGCLPTLGTGNCISGGLGLQRACCHPGRKRSHWKKQMATSAFLPLVRRYFPFQGEKAGRLNWEHCLELLGWLASARSLPSIAVGGEPLLSPSCHSRCPFPSVLGERRTIKREFWGSWARDLGVGPASFRSASQDECLLLCAEFCAHLVHLEYHRPLTFFVFSPGISHR